MSGTTLAGEFLSADEVKALLTDKTTKGIHLKRDYSYRINFSIYGLLIRVKNDGEETRGQWHVKDDGRHCIKWEDSYKTRCFPFKDNGDDSYTKVEGNGKNQFDDIA
ncbi:MAG: hypothetical protein BMS9Abin15_0104 [Gammaproteobacteria bacterium]|nr:MAG: hypothetical protein BMS9Abin15_0104 [Gammaproteobacteria bacterium]